MLQVKWYQIIKIYLKPYHKANNWHLNKLFSASFRFGKKQLVEKHKKQEMFLEEELFE